MRSSELAPVENIEVLIDVSVTKSLIFTSFIHRSFFGSFPRGINHVRLDVTQIPDKI